MSNWKKHDPNHGHKMTPAEKRAKEEEHEKKMIEVRKKTEEDAQVLIQRIGDLIKKTLDEFTKSPDKHIDCWKQLTDLLTECRELNRSNLTDESKDQFVTEAQRITGLADHLSKSFKEMLYARMDKTRAEKQIDLYLEQLHPFALKAHDAGMMTWDEATLKLGEFDTIQAEINAPANKKVMDKYTSMFNALVERLDSVDHTKDILAAYKAYILIWADSFAIRQEHLENPRKFQTFMLKLTDALKMSFAGCNFGNEMFFRCDEEQKLHLKAYADGPFTFNRYQDEFDAIRKASAAH